MLSKVTLKSIRPSSNAYFDCHNPIGITYIIKYITWIRLGLSHLREHKFKHSFQDTLSPICNCGNDLKSAVHFFLHCPLYSNEHRTLLNSLVKIDHNLLDNTNFLLTQTLLFGNTAFNAKENTKIINSIIKFVLSAKTFDEPLLWRIFFFVLILYLASCSNFIYQIDNVAVNNILIILFGTTDLSIFICFVIFHH